MFGSKLIFLIVIVVTLAENEKQKPALTDLLPNQSICGLQHSDDYSHNVNDTVIDEFPWLAIIEYKNKNGNDSVSYRRTCIGSLISARYVLTSAQCLSVTELKPMGVRLGEYHVSNETDCVEDSHITRCSDPLRDFGIEKIITHSDYVREGVNHIHDIGLIRLNTTVEYSDYIRPICLPLARTKRAKVGDKLTTSGWGVTTSQTFSETKKKTHTELITNEDCELQFQQGNVTVKLTNGEICGVLASNSELICVGDGGGPVMYSHKYQWFQEAVVSVATCDKTYPNLYTKVAHYLGWIEENLEP